MKPLLTFLTLLAGTAVLAVQAQTADVPAPPASAASAAQRIEITGRPDSEVEQRRRATAAKIVIGRDEIEAYGDSSVGEVLRRLPGVTTPGRPGRGGAPRLRGLGSGYTQLLIDGEAIPRGFSLESLTPDQVERIEILRAPSAETGARAIAGTINIILREGYRKRLNDLRLGVGVEGGDVSPGLFWTHNDQSGPLTHNFTASVFERRNSDTTQALTRVEDAATGALQSASEERSRSSSLRRGLNLSARLQWRLGEAGDLLMLTPSVFHADTQRSGSEALTQDVGSRPYDVATTLGDSRYTVARLNGQWRQRLAWGGRGELSGTASRWRSDSRSRREEFLGGLTQRVLDDDAQTSESSLSLRGKLTLLHGGSDDVPGSEHSLVAGGELETGRRSERRDLEQDGAPLLADFGDELKASSTRVALFAQDEWNLSPQWALHAGLRWEGITTEGDLGQEATGARPRNRASVWTPLAHAVWKPDPKGRSQVRMSLTRSWRAPALNALIARPRPTTSVPLDQENSPTQPDRAGNPDLRPELATGIDLAFEHYPADGGVLSASLFYRRIHQLMRSVTGLESVAWSPVPRWVSRTQNVGDATTRGIELEAKGRLDQWRPGAPRVDLRASLSLYDSQVDGVPGPDNRLDQQPHASANLGADFKLPGAPLKLGGNLSWVPAYRTRTDETQVVGVSTRRVVDASALWTISPAAALRLQAGNLLPRDSDDFARIGAGNTLETARTLSPSEINWQLRLELKL